MNSLRSCFFEKQKLQYFARRHSLNTHFDNSKKQKRNRRGNKRIFFVPLVDTRSFFYFFIFLKILLCDKTSKLFNNSFTN